MEAQKFDELIHGYATLQTDSALEFFRKEFPPLLLSTATLRNLSGLLMRVLGGFLMEKHGSKQSDWPRNTLTIIYEQLHYLLHEKETLERTCKLFAWEEELEESGGLFEKMS